MLKELSLFVYGTLTEGMVHFNLFSDYVVEKQPAKAMGQVYRLPSGYPVFLSTNDKVAQITDSVCGQLLKIQAPVLVFNLLNEFHGVSLLAPEKSLFFKEYIRVQAHNDVLHEAMVYAFNPAKLPKDAQRIEGGDWEQNLKSEPTLIDTLTEKQTNYVRRLHESTGREIVPIDLELYRELMKIGLIVDKGRRLALSKLGKEVARYLPS